MDENEQRAVKALPIILVVGVCLALAGSWSGLKLAGGLPLYALCIALAFVIQWIVFIPSFMNKTEKFYDLTGGITYVTVAVVGVWLSGSTDFRSVLIMVLVVVWAARLSSFLFRRIQADGHDGRFDKIKISFPRSLFVWTLQGLWVSFSIAAGLAAITAVDKVPFGLIGTIGLIVWLVGFAFEAIADQQKKRFRADPANKGRFIQNGLWSWSRHPNYFGEIVLWLGIAIIAFPVLQGWQYATLISPIFVYLLLTRLSGVPLLEARSDEKWGGQPDYEAYKARTSVLIPRPPSG